MPAILNVLIGIVFVFLVFSLLVSALNEIILSTLDKRADFLQEGLRELLQNPARITQFVNHGLVDALSRKTGGDPSYIGKEAFVAAVLDLVKPAEPGKVRTVADFQAAIAVLPDDRFRQSLTALLDSAGADLAKFKTNLGDWWDRSMQRVSGWYTRYTQKSLFFLGLLIAIACNVDTIHITQILSANPQLAVATANQAADFIRTQAPPDQAAAVKATLDDMVHDVKTSLANLTDLRLPVGWTPAARQHFGIRQPDGGWGWPRDPSVLMTAIFGWLLTALAGTLGAPFWFDTLNRFINVRGNGRAPNEPKIGKKKKAPALDT